VHTAGERAIFQSSQFKASDSPEDPLQSRLKWNQIEFTRNEEASTTFTATDLARCDVLGQVDRKFVACAIKHQIDGKNILILVDQHAADERIRIERFLKEYCNGALSFKMSVTEDTDLSDSTEIERLIPPKQVLLTGSEAKLLQDAAVMQELRRWGIVVEHPSATAMDSEDGRVQISVSGVPTILHTKASSVEYLQRFG
jgi:DNA mismatch repair protein MLH3